MKNNNSGSENERGGQYRINASRFEELLKQSSGYFKDDSGKIIHDKLGRPLKMGVMKDLASLIGITPQALTNNKKGKHQPDLYTLERIGELYNINWQWLCDLSDIKDLDEYKKHVAGFSSTWDQVEGRARDISFVLDHLRSNYDVTVKTETPAPGEFSDFTKDIFIISKDAFSMTLTYQDIERLAAELSDYIIFRLEHLR